MSDFATRELCVPALPCATRDETFGHGLPMRIYGSSDDGPVVVIVSGYPDAGFEKQVGCRFMEMQSVKTWASHIAAAGVAAITYGNREPIADLATLLRALATRDVRIFASSGNVPAAISALPHATRAALLYGYMLDVDEAASQFRFANPRCTIDDVPNIPLMIVRAGRDEMPRLNDSIDAFTRDALARNLPVTLVNHAEAPHAFDLMHDTPRSREVIEEVIRFIAN